MRAHARPHPPPLGERLERRRLPDPRHPKTLAGRCAGTRDGRRLRDGVGRGRHGPRPGSRRGSARPADGPRPRPALLRLPVDAHGSGAEGHEDRTLDGAAVGRLPLGRTTGLPRQVTAPSGEFTGEFTTPAEAGREGASVRSVNYPDRYWHISGDYVRLDPITSTADRRAATFTVVKGLANSGCYSFATADGGYLRHRDFLLRAEHDDGTDLFRQDATFCPRPSSVGGATMLESVNYPGRFLRHQNFRLKLDPYQDTDPYRADSAFRLVDAPA
ncbi:AbfB domain-containing protein [Streptomyces lasalocidi]